MERERAGRRSRTRERRPVESEAGERARKLDEEVETRRRERGAWSTGADGRPEWVPADGEGGIPVAPATERDGR